MIRDLKTGKVLHELWNSKGITSITVYDNKCILGSHGEIVIWDLKTGRCLKRLDWQGRVFRCLKVYDGKLILCSDDKLILCSDDKTIVTLDFNFPSLSSYSKPVLKENLNILEKMSWAQYIWQPVEELAEKLHSDFKERLRRHCFKVRGSFPSSVNAILRLKTEVCVESLLDAIRDEDHTRVSNLLDYLIWIEPENTKIYELLGEICGDPDPYWVKYAFRNQQRCSATLFEKEKAVLAFKQMLKDKWGEDLPLLLADLGIVTEEEYSTILKCRPDSLPERGISTNEDLQVLFNSPDFQYLKISAEEVVEDYAQSQTGASNKKKIVSTLLEKLLTAAQQKWEETMQCAVLSNEVGIVYDADNPWTAFLEKLNSAKAALNTARLTRQEVLDKFNPESYAKIVKEINGLIDEFRTLEPGTQILRLRAYITQWGILKVWNGLRKQGIESLAVLLKQKDAPRDIFRMGV